VIGHRGAAGIAPENTLASLRAALMLGVDGVEGDVRRSRDGVLVLMHDDTLERVTGVQGAVAECDWAQLATLRVAGSEPIPTLGDWLELVGEQAEPVIELKVDGIEEACLREVRRRGLARRALWISFATERLRRLRQLDPEARIGALYAGATERSLQEASDLGATIVDVLYKDASAELVRTARQRYGLQVWAWTVNDEPTMAALAHNGVQALTTDRPDLALAWRRSLS